MTWRGEVLHALGECECSFKSSNFLDLLEKERRWLVHLLFLVHLRNQHKDRRREFRSDEIAMMTVRDKDLRN